MLIQLCFTEPSSSQEGDFSTAPGSATGHLLSLVADRPCAVYQLHSTIEIPSLPGLPQNLAVVFPLCSTLHSIPLSRGCGCRLCLWGTILEQALSKPAAFHPGIKLNFTPVIPVQLHILLGCEYNFSVSSSFAPSQHSPQHGKGSQQTRMACFCKG